MRIRLYVEGGPVGVDAEGVRSIRKAFKQHFERLDPRLKSLVVVVSGSTDQTIKSFAEGKHEYYPDYCVALLVDSDAPVSASSPGKHLESKLNSAAISQDAQSEVFLMVQCMEAWLVTDVVALEKCFGNKVREIKFPANPNIEAVPKKDILAALNVAAKVRPARHYHKIRDGAKILAELSPKLVAERSKHASALHEFLRRSVSV